MNLKKLIPVFILILAMIMLSGCSRNTESTAAGHSEAQRFTGGMPGFAGGPNIGLMKEADKKWSLPEILKTYQKVISLYENDKSAEAIKLVRTVADKDIKLLPDGTELLSDADIGTYMGGRLMPAIGIIRNVFSANQSYANRLAESGDIKTSMGVNAVNACIARQTMHILPSDNMILMTGNSLWSDAWDSISARFAAVKERRKAKEASGLSKAAKRFANVRINAASDISDPLSISGQNELKHTVELWDQDVDTDPAGDLLNELLAE